MELFGALDGYNQIEEPEDVELRSLSAPVFDAAGGVAYMLTMWGRWERVTSEEPHASDEQEGGKVRDGQVATITSQPTHWCASGRSHAVGLTCGGILDIYVQPSTSHHLVHLPAVSAAVEDHRPVAMASVVSGPDGPGGDLVVTSDVVLGSLGDPTLDEGAVEHIRGLLAGGSTGVFRCGPHGEQRRDDVTIFVQSFVQPPRMLVFGAIDFAKAMSRMGKFLGYHVTVCDARPVFATSKRFPEADVVVVDWPHRFLQSLEVDERTVICVLTHDPKFDVPLLKAALDTPARYVGAMGSWRTHRERLEKLSEAGVEPEALARLSSPIGLDLGARTAEETALAIAAEIVAQQWGGTGQRLTGSGLQIHR